MATAPREKTIAEVVGASVAVLLAIVATVMAFGSVKATAQEAKGCGEKALARTEAQQADIAQLKSDVRVVVVKQEAHGKKLDEITTMLREMQAALMRGDGNQ